MSLIFFGLHRQCLVLAVVSLVWWLGVMALAIFYSALGDEQDAREVYFDMVDMGGKAGRILFFPVTPFSLYLTVKLAFVVACVMIAGASCLILGVLWRDGSLCLVYICALFISGAGQILVIVISWDDPPVPSFWYLLEIFIAYCVCHLRANLNSRAINVSPYYEVYPVSMEQNATEEIRFASDSAENSDKINDEAQVKGKKRRKRHRRHRRSYDLVDEEVPAAGAENGLDQNLNSGGAKNVKCGG